MLYFSWKCKRLCIFLSSWLPCCGDCSGGSVRTAYRSVGARRLAGGTSPSSRRGSSGIPAPSPRLPPSPAARDGPAAAGAPAAVPEPAEPARALLTPLCVCLCVFPCRGAVPEGRRPGVQRVPRRDGSVLHLGVQAHPPHRQPGGGQQLRRHQRL